jgi:hypothetical protein
MSDRGSNNSHKSRDREVAEQEREALRSALLRILPRKLRVFLSGRIQDHPVAMELVRKALNGDWRSMKKITDIVEGRIVMRRQVKTNSPND